MKRLVAVGVRWIACVWLAGMIVAANSSSLAQDPAAPGEKAERGARAKKADKLSGRVPAYYAKVKLTPEQREKILAVQAEYAAKIDPLRKQLEALTKERDAKIAAVLTPEQQKLMDEMKAAAKKPREGKKTAKDKPAAGAAEEKAAVK